MTYWEWIAQEAALIHADGCTGVTNYQGGCCLQHDLEFWHGKSAVDAFTRWRNGEQDYWRHAAPTTFDEANQHFKRCHFRMSALGHWDPIAWARYGAMRLKKTRAAWDGHRQREAQTA